MKIYFPYVRDSIKTRLKSLIHNGDLVNIATKDNYSAIRLQLHELAGEYADNDDVVRMGIALSEIKRLDEKLGYKVVDKDASD